jgi:hypothetical protein
MRITLLTMALGTMLAATLGAPSAFAQGDYRHHAFCLRHGSSQECAYDSFQQCEAAKSGGQETCVPNGPPQNH